MVRNDSDLSTCANLSDSYPNFTHGPERWYTTMPDPCMMRLRSVRYTAMSGTEPTAVLLNQSDHVRDTTAMSINYFCQGKCRSSPSTACNSDVGSLFLSLY